MRGIGERARAGAGDLRWALGVFALLLVILGTWVVGMPRYAAPDEVAHTIKAYGTAHGEAIGEEIPGISPLTRTMRSPANLASAGQACFAFQPQVPASCAPSTTDPSVVELQTSAATYPPAYYLAVGGLARLAGRAESLRAYRAISVTMVAALLAAALALASRLGRGRPALVLLALTPMAVFMGAAVNPTAIEIAGCLLLWVHLACLAVDPSPPTTGQLVAASSIAAAVVLVRPVAAPWVALALAAYLVVDRRPLSPGGRELARRAATVAAPLAAAALASVAWSRYAGVGLADDKYLDESATVDVLRLGLGRTGELFDQAIGRLGWLDTSLPLLSSAPAKIALVLAVAIALHLGDRRTRLLTVTLVAVWVAYPAVYVTLARTPLVWQGRYNLPLLGGLVFAVVVAARRDPDGRVVAHLAAYAAGAFALVEVLAFHQALRRFMVGAAGDVLLRDPAWYPAVSAWVLVALNAAAAVALASLCVLSPRARVDR